MIYYLTYNEPFSGIFNSQVVDVVKHLRTEHQQEIRLISFVPIGFKMTYYKELSAKLRKAEPAVIIIPAVPVQYGWKFNWFLLSLILLFRKKGSIISREVQATYLAIKCRAFKLVHKVCYDARGANYAQMKEYDIYSPNIKEEIFELEKFAVFNSNFRLAVSQALVDYWKRVYNYSSNQYVVIPTTISSSLARVVTIIVSLIHPPNRLALRPTTQYTASGVHFRSKIAFVMQENILRCPLSALTVIRIV